MFKPAPSSLARPLQALIWVIWLGLHLSAGYVVAPVLFRHLDKISAGHIAGVLFAITAYLSLAAVPALLALEYCAVARVAPGVKRLAMAIWLISAANQGLITPVIQDLKAGTRQAWLTELSHSFGLWHGISSTLYLLVGVLALWWLWLWARKRD